jgi:TolA-binding protein
MNRAPPAGKRGAAAGPRRRLPLGGTAFLSLLALAPLHAATTDWFSPESPYRAVYTMVQPPKYPEAGWALELPDFGAAREDAADVLVTDAAGRRLPAVVAARGMGRDLVLLVRENRAEQEFHVYFGGKNPSPRSGWDPMVSLLLETRRLPPRMKFGEWPEVQAAWAAAKEVDGAGLVGSVWHGGNPWGDNANFLSHYAGWIPTEGAQRMTFYTQSSDSSFVQFNGRMELEWPGAHRPDALPKSVPQKEIATPGRFVRVDYWHAKGPANDGAVAVLGWMKDGKLQPVPDAAWVKPGATHRQRLESLSGAPVPAFRVDGLTYLGFGDEWYFEARSVLLSPLPFGWEAKWEFEDGSVATGPSFRRVMFNPSPQTVTLRLRKGAEEVVGRRRVNFYGPTNPASVNRPGDVARYLELLGKERPDALSPAARRAAFVLLQAFGADAAAGRFAAAWLKTDPPPASATWLAAQLARLRALAQSDPAKALSETRALQAPAVRAAHGRALDHLELELLVFYLRSDEAEAVAQRIIKEAPGTAEARVAAVRVADLRRLQGKLPEAAARYAALQKSTPDPSEGRRAPAQDRAFAVAVEDLLDRRQREEAERRLGEWERARPSAKMDTDFLLHRARVLMAFGRWGEALAEADSLRQVSPEGPWQVDADFLRAGILAELGRKDEARKVWAAIVEKYPHSEWAKPSKEALARKETGDGKQETGEKKP